MGMDQADYKLFEWLRGYYPDADPQDLPKSLSGLRFAMNNENCHQKCPGIDKCPTHGYIMKPFRVGFGSSLVFTTAGEPCRRGTDERRQVQVQKTVAGCGVPEKYAECTFDNFNIFECDKKIHMALSLTQKCTQYGLSLLLGGPPGTGKTHLAISQIKQYLSNGKTALFMPVITLLDEIKRGFENNTSIATEDAVKNADFVVLDDLGTQYDTGWVSERLFSLIDYRYSHKLPITITTNACNLELLEKMAGSGSGFRIISRIKDTDFGHVTFLTGCKDYRGMRVQTRLAV